MKNTVGSQILNKKIYIKGFMRQQSTYSTIREESPLAILHILDTDPFFYYIMFIMTLNLSNDAWEIVYLDQ